MRSFAYDTKKKEILINHSIKALSFHSQVSVEVEKCNQIKWKNNKVES